MNNTMTFYHGNFRSGGALSCRTYEIEQKVCSSGL